MRDNSYILCQLYIGQLQCNSHGVFRPTICPRSNQAQCSVSVTPSFHRHLKTVEHIYWRIVSSSSQLTADSCSAVMPKANNTCTVHIHVCGVTGIKGRNVSRFGSSGRLTHWLRRCRIYSNQIVKCTLSCTNDPIDSILNWRSVLTNYRNVRSDRCAVSHVWKKMSICDFVSCNVYNIYVKSWNHGISNRELWKSLYKTC
jgi:hypothetical protein